MTLTNLLGQKRIVVCVGSGGVGKTSVAAAVALRATLEGRVSLVVTFDPSRRLASSLGLGQAGLGSVPQPLAADRYEKAGLSPRGELLAMHLDVKRTMDELIRRHAPSPAHAARILGNRLYQSLSTTLPGAHEYMAMEKLYELSQDRGYDLLVLDTPPASAAIDFIDAPQRILTALAGDDALRWIANPAVAAGRLGGKIVRHISAFTGGPMLQALGEFLLALQDMYAGLRQRAEAVQALLASSATSFLLVTNPDPLGVEEALRFYGVLRLRNLAVDTVVVNRVQPDWRAATGGADLSSDVLGTTYAPALAARLAKIVAEQQAIAAAHREAVAGLRDYLDLSASIQAVPLLLDDPHDLASLADIGRYLFEGHGGLPAAALPAC